MIVGLERYTKSFRFPLLSGNQFSREGAFKRNLFSKRSVLALDDIRPPLSSDAVPNKRLPRMPVLGNDGGTVLVDDADVAADVAEEFKEGVLG